MSSRRKSRAWSHNTTSDVFDLIMPDYVKRLEEWSWQSESNLKIIWSSANIFFIICDLRKWSAICTYGGDLLMWDFIGNESWGSWRGNTYIVPDKTHFAFRLIWRNAFRFHVGKLHVPLISSREKMELFFGPTWFPVSHFAVPSFLRKLFFQFSHFDLLFSVFMRGDSCSFFRDIEEGVVLALRGAAKYILPRFALIANFNSASLYFRTPTCPSWLVSLRGHNFCLSELRKRSGIWCVFTPETLEFLERGSYTTGVLDFCFF